MAVWTDDYCFVSQCFLYNREKPIAWWMYGPEQDSQFTESVSGIVSIRYSPRRACCGESSELEIQRSRVRVLLTQTKLFWNYFNVRLPF